MWQWDQQEPFGDNVADENPSGLGAFDLPLRLPGQRYDKETNLHYNYFRDYDPSRGAYEESDRIGLKGGLNTYVYVSAEPLARTDVFGLCDTVFMYKTNWELAWGDDKKISELQIVLPRYKWETSAGPNWGALRDPREPPLTPRMCYRHVGNDITAIEVWQHVDFWQNNKYRQTCSNCNACGSLQLSCGEWEKVGPIDAKEKSGLPWLKSNSWFEEVQSSICVKVPFRLPGMRLR